MKVTSGYALLLITIGLFILVGQEFIDPTSLGYTQEASQPTPCIQSNANFMDEAMQLERRETELDNRQAELETREADLAKRESELAQAKVTIEKERIAIQEDKDRVAQEEQRLKDLQRTLEDRDTQLDLKEIALTKEIKKLEDERSAVHRQYNEYRVVLRVLYGLIVVTFVVLIANIWLAYRLNQTSRWSLAPTRPPG